MKLPTVSEFLASPLRNSWCAWPHTISGVYLRKSQHLPVGPTVDISNLTVQDQWQGKGTFRALVLHVAVRAPQDWHIYVENVQTYRFALHFRRLGWRVGPVTGICGEPCFYMPVPEVCHVYSPLVHKQLI